MNFTANLLGTTLLSAIALANTATAQDLSRVATMPAGAEVTGLSVNGMGEVFLNAQHVGGSNYLKEDGQPATLGYFDGLDTANYSAGDVAIPPEEQRSVVHVADGAYIVLAKAGEPLGDGKVLGGVYDTSGNLMYISNAPDFNGFIPTSGTTAYLYTGWEGTGRDGAGAVSRLPLKRVDGKWQADLAGGAMLGVMPESW